jgi:hypothetical protein
MVGLLGARVHFHATGGESDVALFEELRHAVLNNPQPSIAERTLVSEQTSAGTGELSGYAINHEQTPGAVYWLRRSSSQTRSARASARLAQVAPYGGRVRASPMGWKIAAVESAAIQDGGLHSQV